jgi:hypothetical protein
VDEFLVGICAIMNFVFFAVLEKSFKGGERVASIAKFSTRD